MATKLPDRTAGGSVSDDEAVPDHDPSNVNLSLWQTMNNTRLTIPRLLAYFSSDFRPTSTLVATWKIISLLRRRSKGRTLKNTRKS